jgi:hypothetical protein
MSTKRSTVPGDYHLESICFVNAPRCPACKVAMSAANATHWKCTNSNCSEHGQPMHIGVYPILSLKETNHDV